MCKGQRKRRRKRGRRGEREREREAARKRIDVARLCDDACMCDCAVTHVCIYALFGEVIGSNAVNIRGMIYADTFGYIGKLCVEMYTVSVGF